MSVKLIAVILALVCTMVLANPVERSNYIEQENSCRQVCGLCDCNGFYCEDECICECNLEEDESKKVKVVSARKNSKYIFNLFRSSVYR